MIDMVEMPVGYRFCPTEEELVLHYLKKKAVHRGPLQDINASELYSKSPNSLVRMKFEGRERQWYFYLHEDEEFDESEECIRLGNGVGFWTKIGNEKSVCDSAGDILAFKSHFTFFSGTPSCRKETHWKMDQFRLPVEEMKGKKEGVIGRLIRGKTTRVAVFKH